MLSKVLNAEKINRVNRILLIVFLVLQPVFEVVSGLFDGNEPSIAGVSITLLLKFGMFAVIFLLAVAVNIKKNTTKIFICYVAVCAVFVVLQYFNLRGFNLVLHGESLQKSITQCIGYAAKYAIAVGIIFLVRILNFSYKELKVAIVLVVALVASHILITNLFGIDYISYRFGSKLNPLGNMLSWFKGGIDITNWRDFTSRGWFNSGNSLSAFFSLTLPITIFIALKEKKLVYFVLILSQLLAMLLQGTRISVYGAMIIIAMVIAIVVFDLILNKGNINIKSLIAMVLVIAIFGTFFIISPFVSRLKNGEGLGNNFEGDNVSIVIPEEDEMGEIEEDNSSDNNISSDKDNSSDIDNSSGQISQTESRKEYKMRYIEENYIDNYISKTLLYELYDYREHTDFWYDLMTKVDFSKRNNSREIRVLILADVAKTKGGEFDILVGIGEMSVYPESDFAAIYYYFGVLGLIIFVFPFIAILVASIIRILIRLFKRNVDPLEYVLILSLGFILITAHVAGHTMLFSYVNSFIGLVSGVMLNILLESEEGTIK